MTVSASNMNQILNQIISMAMKSSDHLEDLRNPYLVLKAVALREGGAVTHVQVSLDQPLLELHHLRDLFVVDLVC